MLAAALTAFGLAGAETNKPETFEVDGNKANLQAAPLRLIGGSPRELEP
jgi:hypothetical protein